VPSAVPKRSLISRIRAFTARRTSCRLGLAATFVTSAHRATSHKTRAGHETCTWGSITYAEQVISPSQVSRSLLVFVTAIVLVGIFVGHTLTAAGIAFFLFLLAAIEGKPSWKRIWNPDRGDGGILKYMSWKRVDARPGDRGDPTVRPKK
jgi:hypothetical protein